MITLVKAPSLPMVSYYIRKEYAIRGIDTIDSIMDIGPVIEKQGNKLGYKQVYSLLDLSNESKIPNSIKEKAVSKWHHIFIYGVEGDYPCITLDELYYYYLIEPIAFILDQGGLEYLWNTYGTYPHKLELEVIYLLEYFSIKKDKIYKDDIIQLLKGRSSITNTTYYLNTIGKPLGNKIINELSDSDLWLTFMGDPPLIYDYLINRCPMLYHLIRYKIDTYYYHGYTLRTAALLMNLFIINNYLIDSKNPYNWKIGKRK